MSRIERLINLSAALLSAERPLRAEELRERIAGYPDDKGSFRRQFERDKDALRELGLPLETITERRGAEDVVAYRVNADDYYVRDPGLEPDELSALHLASRLVEIEGLDTGSGLWKLNAAARAERSRRGTKTGRVDVSDTPSGDGILSPTASLPADDRLTELFGLIASGASVGFGYKGESRTVQPRRLSFSRAHWYLIAYDLDRAADRSFRLDRIEGQLIPGEAHTPPSSSRGASAAAFSRPWELGEEGGEVTAVVVVDAAQGPWAVRHVGPAAVLRTLTDGSVELALTVRNREAFRTFVLGFLEHAEIVSPLELRGEFITWLESIATSEPARKS